MGGYILKSKLLLAIEQGRFNIKQLEKELEKIEYSSKSTIKELDGEVYYNELIPAEHDFSSKDDFSRYIFLSSKLDNLKFLVEEVLYNMLLGDEQELIKDSYSNCYDDYMNGFNSAILSFVNLF